MNFLTAGESFRRILKTEGIQQNELAQMQDAHPQSISKTLKNFDNNKGSITKLIEYANTIGYAVEFNFIKK